MDIITTTDSLAQFCQRAAQHPFVTLDTEFIRENTYYSKLCLIQAAYGDGTDGADTTDGNESPDSPESANESAVLIDPLATGLSLDPLYDLFQNPKVTKVFHSARQDLEIFYHSRQILPAPFFDTQIAAMVCGYGEQVSYEHLVRAICKVQIDKGSRFSDWARRPLSNDQKHYALGDVTHLRGVYKHLQDTLADTGRADWVGQEQADLLDPALYTIPPEQAYLRIKTRNLSGAKLSLVRELAAFREIYAESRDIPRGRVLKDDAILELAAQRPKSKDDLLRSRGLQRITRKTDIVDGIMAALERGHKRGAMDAPSVKKRSAGAESLCQLLRVLLKASAEESGVAQKLIATSAQIDAIAEGDTGSRVFTGWRNEIFGAQARRLCDGKIALTVSGNKIKIVPMG